MSDVLAFIRSTILLMFTTSDAKTEMESRVLQDKARDWTVVRSAWNNKI